MENRAEFRLEKRIFLGILGNLGSKIDSRNLSKMTRASGLNGHGKRGKTQENRERMSKISGNPRISIYRGLNRLGTRGVRSYAARTRTSCMSESSTASASDGTDRMGRVGWGGLVVSHRRDVDDPMPLIRVRGAYEGTQGVLQSYLLTPLRILPRIYI